MANRRTPRPARGRRGGWEVLYPEPRDGRFWELIYPHSQMQGGGPPRLHLLSSKEARAKYCLVPPNESL